MYDSQEKNTADKEHFEIEFIERNRQWRDWCEKYEKADFEKRWSEAELQLQEDLRRSGLEILENSRKPAFRGERFTLEQVQTLSSNAL